MTDGWRGYEWINNEDSGYSRIGHVHDLHDFGYGIESTSHVESIWSQLKQEIKSIYYIIPMHNFLYYLKECEWRIKTKVLSNEQKIEDFFEMYNLIKTVGSEDLKDEDFLNNDNLNSIDSSSDEDN